MRGTRIPVELVLEHLAQNYDMAQLRAAFPKLSTIDVQACLLYALRRLEGEHFIPRFPSAAA